MADDAPRNAVVVKPTPQSINDFPLGPLLGSLIGWADAQADAEEVIFCSATAAAGRC
jgi:hypothetical protein